MDAKEARAADNFTDIHLEDSFASLESRMLIRRCRATFLSSEIWPLMGPEVPGESSPRLGAWREGQGPMIFDGGVRGGGEAGGDDLQRRRARWLGGGGDVLYYVWPVRTHELHEALARSGCTTHTTPVRSVRDSLFDLHLFLAALSIVNMPSTLLMDHTGTPDAEPRLAQTVAGTVARRYLR